MIETVKNKRPSKDPTRKVGGLSLGALTSKFKKAEKATGTLSAAKKVPPKKSSIAELFGKKNVNATGRKQEVELSRNQKVQKKRIISKKAQETEGEKVQAKKTKEEVEAQKLELKQEAKTKAKDIFDDANFKDRFDVILGKKKASNLGKKVDDATIRTEVTTKMDDLKVKQKAKAEAKAKKARDEALATTKQASEAKKLSLKEKLDLSKRKLQEKLDGLTDPVKRQQIKEKKMQDNAKSARQDANVQKQKAKELREDAEVKERKAREARERADNETDPNKKNEYDAEAKRAEADARKAREDATNAKKKADNMRRKAYESEQKVKKVNDDADDINNPRNNNDIDPEGRRINDEADEANLNARKAREDADVAKNKAKDLEDDAKVKQRKAKEARKKAQDEPDPNKRNELDNDARRAEAEARKARQDADAARRKAKKLNDDAKAKQRKAREANEKAKKLREPENKMDPPKRDRFNEENMKNKAKKAKGDADLHVKKRFNFKKALKKFLGKLIGLLLMLIGLILPYLKKIIPLICPGSPGCPSGPDKGDGDKDPSVIVFPLSEVPPPPPPPPPEEKEEEAPPPEAEEPPEAEPPEGAIVFKLSTQPEEDITFKLESLSDYLEFDESSITFRVESWDTPVYVTYTTSLDTEPEEDDTYEDLKADEEEVEDEGEGEEEEPSAIKRKSIYKETEPTIEQLVAHRKNLNTMLKKPKTFKERLEEVQRRVSLREQYGGEESVPEEIVEPNYDDENYKEYVNEVTPSIHVKPVHDEDEYTKILEEVVEPTYESDYESLHEEVVPTMEGGQEDDSENNSENNSEEDNVEETNNSSKNISIEDLDYEALTSEIDATNLAENFKAEFKLTLYQDITYKLDVNIEVDSDVFTIEPSKLTFSGNDAEQNSFFFSSIIYESLKRSYAEKKATELGDEYLNSAEQEYDEAIEEIESEDTEAENEANKIYENTYKESIENTDQQIENGENVLEQLEGGYVPKTTFLNKFKNRTHKLR